MQCLFQLITKEQTQLSKIWGTVQTCREENAILLVWSRDKYYFHEFLKLSRACEIVQKNIAKISLFVMFIYFFFFWFPIFIFIFLTIFHPSPTTRHPLPVTRYPPPVTCYPRKSPAVTCQAKAKISSWSHPLAIPERHKNNRPWISTEEKIQIN